MVVFLGHFAPLCDHILSLFTYFVSPFGQYFCLCCVFFAQLDANDYLLTSFRI